MSMQHDDLQPGLRGIILEEQAELTLVEVSRACAVEVQWIIEFVDEGVLEPRGGERHDWRFSGPQLRRAITALRLQRDLGLNPAGVALALQLLDEIDVLRARLNELESR